MVKNGEFAFSEGDFSGLFSARDQGHLDTVTITSLPTSGSLSLSGMAVSQNDPVSYTELTSLTYTPAKDYSGQVSFDWSGSEGGTTFEFTTVINVVDGTNNAPSLDTTCSRALPDNGGCTVAAVIPDGAITDSDSSPTSAAKAIAVTSADDSNGTWQYKVRQGDRFTAWTDMDELSESNALLRGPGDMVRFLSNGNYRGAATFSFRAWDETDGRRPGGLGKYAENGRRDSL